MLPNVNWRNDHAELLFLLGDSSCVGDHRWCCKPTDHGWGGDTVNYVTYYRVRAYAPGKALLRIMWDWDEAVEYAARQPAPGAFVQEVVIRPVIRND